MASPPGAGQPTRWQSVVDELAFLRFMLPRETVQLAGRHLPLETLRVSGQRAAGGGHDAV